MGAQLYWQQQQYPSMFSQVSTILTWPQYWVHKLTGERCNDVSSLGCHTDLYEPQRRRYSSLVETQQWRSLMPPTKCSGQLSGTVSASIADRAGLAPTVPVYTGIHDSNASLVPHLIAQSTPFSVVSTGTWFIAMAIGGQRIALDGDRDTLINVNAQGESVPSARFMGGRERELLNISKPVTEQAMEQLLCSDARQTMLMPSVVSDTGPFPKLAKKWLGAKEGDNSSSQACAATLYLALMTHECLCLIGANGPTFIEGPLAQDPQYAQMLAAVSQRPVMISAAVTGTSVGAAMLISAPEKPPDYTAVKLNDEKQLMLERYAKLWKQQLAKHT